MPQSLLRASPAGATLSAVSESAYKPTNEYEDELDQLAHSIRDELRSAGFRPAFDLEPEIAPASQVEQSRRRRRLTLRRTISGYVAPMMVMIAVFVLLRVILPVL